MKQFSGEKWIHLTKGRGCSLFQNNWNTNEWESNNQSKVDFFRSLNSWNSLISGSWSLIAVLFINSYGALQSRWHMARPTRSKAKWICPFSDTTSLQKNNYKGLQRYTQLILTLNVNGKKNAGLEFQVNTYRSQSK